MVRFDADDDAPGEGGWLCSKLGLAGFDQPIRSFVSLF